MKTIKSRKAKMIICRCVTAVLLTGFAICIAVLSGGKKEADISEIQTNEIETMLQEKNDSMQLETTASETMLQERQPTTQEKAVGNGVEPGTYRITQYSNSLNVQSMFYTIENSDGYLILIDGGWSADAQYVHDIISSKGGTVNAWILTHPHPDHIGAFNVIYESYKDINIEQIYAVELNSVKYHEMAQPWDEIGVYDKFCSITYGDPNLHYMKKCETFNLGGLMMNIYSVYQSDSPAMQSDLANNGSAVFELSAQNSSMLFCSDIGQEVREELLPEYGEIINTDYIQLAHHGNSSTDQEFYRMASPSIAFFDAPAWMMYPGTDTRFKNPEAIALMQEMGAAIYYFGDIPNSIIMR